MPTEVRVPEVGEGVSAVRVAAWVKREGEHVQAGESIVELETDKTNFEVESPAAGVLLKILVPANSDGVAVDSVLALVGDSESAAEQAAGVAASDERRPAKSRHDESASRRDVPAVATRSDSRRPESAVQAAIVVSPANINATPIARKIAELAGIDLSNVKPIKGNKITREDLERLIGQPLSARQANAQFAPQRAQRPAVEHASRSEYRDVPLTTARRVTGMRLQEAKRDIPHFYLQCECRVDALLKLRAEWNQRLKDQKLTITDFVAFVISRAARQVPEVNCAWGDNAVRVYSDVDLGIAVNTAKGLIAPIVRQSQQKNLSTISREIAMLAEKARAGKLQPADYTGATFTVSNLGMFGVTAITPIVNPPGACIVGIGAIESRAIVDDGELTAGHTMVCTLAADHRAIDGALAAQFMATLRSKLENPMSLVFDV